MMKCVRSKSFLASVQFFIPAISTIPFKRGLIKSDALRGLKWITQNVFKFPKWPFYSYSVNCSPIAKTRFLLSLAIKTVLIWSVHKSFQLSESQLVKYFEIGHLLKKKWYYGQTRRVRLWRFSWMKSYCKVYFLGGRRTNAPPAPLLSSLRRFQSVIRLRKGTNIIKAQMNSHKIRKILSSCDRYGSSFGICWLHSK